MDASPTSSAPAALRGEALRATLAALMAAESDSPPIAPDAAEVSAADDLDDASHGPIRGPHGPWPLEASDVPGSSGPPALRPHELSRCFSSDGTGER